MADDTGDHFTVRINRWAVALGALGIAFAAGMGLMSRMSNIEDAPVIHRDHDRRLQAIERAVCTDRGISSEDCDLYWRGRRE